MTTDERAEGDWFTEGEEAQCGGVVAQKEPRT